MLSTYGQGCRAASYSLHARPSPERSIFLPVPNRELLDTAHSAGCRRTFCYVPVLVHVCGGTVTQFPVSGKDDHRLSTSLGLYHLCIVSRTRLVDPEGRCRPFFHVGVVFIVLSVSRTASTLCTSLKKNSPLSYYSVTQLPLVKPAISASFLHALV